MGKLDMVLMICFVATRSVLDRADSAAIRFTLPFSLCVCVCVSSSSEAARAMCRAHQTAEAAQEQEDSVETDSAKGEVLAQSAVDPLATNLRHLMGTIRRRALLGPWSATNPLNVDDFQSAQTPTLRWSDARPTPIPSSG